MKKRLIKSAFVMIATFIMINNSYSQTLCLNFTAFTATRSDCEVNLNWKLVQCVTGTFYVQYSVNGSTYATVAVINSNSNTGGTEEEYSYTDSYACPGFGGSNVYYQILFISSSSGTNYYSPVRSVDMSNCYCTLDNNDRCEGLPTLSITGNNAICTNSSETYLISNSIYPVTWSITSGSSLVTITSSSLTSITISNSSNSTGTGATITLTATVYGCLTITKTIMLGLPPNPTNIYGLNPPMSVSQSEILELDADNSEMPAYEWTTTGGTISGVNYNSHVTVQADACAPPLTNGYITVSVSYINSCGASNPYGEATTTDCNSGGGLRVSIAPNPVKNGYVYISINNNNKSVADKISNVAPVQIKLFDILTNQIVREWNFNGNQYNYTLNVERLKKGQYIIQIIKGESKQTKQILIN